VHQNLRAAHQSAREAIAVIRLRGARRRRQKDASDGPAPHHVRLALQELGRRPAMLAKNLAIDGAQSTLTLSDKGYCVKVVALCPRKLGLASRTRNREPSSPEGDRAYELPRARSRRIGPTRRLVGADVAEPRCAGGRDLVWRAGAAQAAFARTARRLQRVPSSWNQFQIRAVIQLSSNCLAPRLLCLQSQQGDSDDLRNLRRRCWRPRRNA